MSELSDSHVPESSAAVDNRDPGPIGLDGDPIDFEEVGGKAVRVSAARRRHRRRLRKLGLAHCGVDYSFGTLENAAFTPFAAAQDDRLKNPDTTMLLIFTRAHDEAPGRPVDPADLAPRVGKHPKAVGKSLRRLIAAGYIEASAVKGGGH